MTHTFTNGKGLLTIIAIGLMPAALQAKHLTPDQALSMASASKCAKIIGESTDIPRLAYMAPSLKSADASVYVFSRPQNKGFMILSADDAVGDIVLGYSEDDSFSADSIPPALDWLLSQYAAYVDEAAAVSGAFGNEGMDVKSEIAPICQTKWDQGDPYWDMCPTIGSEHCPTGCAATALAQVLKAHNWPSRGTGSHSYTFQYNGHSYTESCDFSSIAFDWNNMLNVYDASATTAQKNAVAQLMHACGVALNMQYTPDESGASLLDLLTGAYGYFDIDGSVQVLSRDWVTFKQWEETIYDQLSQGLPIIYTAQDMAQSGHAFVCDGYNEGYFHINWGWSGMADGYFKLVDLNPFEQGIGGGSEISGFNIGQFITINIKPQQNSETSGVLFYDGAPITDKTLYNRNSGSYVKFTSEVVNISAGNVYYAIGLAYDLGGQTNYMQFGNVSMENYQAITNFGIPTKSLPIGVYDAWLVYRIGNGQWLPINLNVDVFSPKMRFEVTQQTVAITNPNVNEVIGQYESCSAQDVVSAGKTYSFVYNVNTLGAYSGSLVLGLVDENGEIQIKSNAIQVNLSKSSQAQTVRFYISIPSDFASGMYALQLYAVAGSEYSPCSSLTVFDINGAEQGIGSVESDAAQARYFDMRGLAVAHPQEGNVYIVRQRTRCAKVAFMGR